MTVALSPRIRLNPFVYRRRPSRVVWVGNVPMGGTEPIRVQSMTTTLTKDTLATVNQSKRLVDVGCEIVRITAPTVLDAKNLETIKNTLVRDGYDVPLVADIHFRPDAALEAANFVEKVRVNPGNFVDGKAFKIREYTDQQYEDELNRLEDKFTPLVLKLKKLNRALRIGTNHGSLSDRIMNRFGDTPLGMVESALEFARICIKNNYHDLIFSMKASNPKVMIAAYRLLAERMDQEGMDYPFHLGVTEAGAGEDGRIKSSVGIGSLLEDGIGDTIRVSLTEDPEYEIPVAQALANRYSNYKLKIKNYESHGMIYVAQRTTYSRRPSTKLTLGPVSLGGEAPIAVAATKPSNNPDRPAEIILSPYSKSIQKIKGMPSHSFWVTFKSGSVPKKIVLEADAVVYHFEHQIHQSEIDRLIELGRPLVFQSSSPEFLIQALSETKDRGLPLAAAFNLHWSIHDGRRFIALLNQNGFQIPVLWVAPQEASTLTNATLLGSLLCDGLGDGILSPSLDFSYDVLQACGSRSTKTDYVSCPSCGRTLFDLQTTTERIKSKTGHLKGVKIAIMGCIVNGPGEMADADFGYVGGGPGKINLYVGKTCVEKSIPTEYADNKLIDLIKQHGKWIEP